MHPSRAPSSHPSTAASLPCPSSAASTTATFATRRSRSRRTLPLRQRDQSAIGARAMVLPPAAQKGGPRALMLNSMDGHRPYPTSALIGPPSRAFNPPHPIFPNHPSPTPPPTSTPRPPHPPP